MYFSPRIRTLVALCAAIALVALGLPVTAQNLRPRANDPHADLRIKVIVVPAIARHHKDKDKERDEGTVAYDLQPEREELSVTEEMRPMLVESGNSAARQEQVRIVTVVAK